MKGKIVIVDSRLAHVLKKMLDGTRADIYTAETLADAVEVINAQQPDIITLENYIPNDVEDRHERPYGGEIAKACKHLWRGVRIVGLSSMPGAFSNAEYFDVILSKRRDIKRYRAAVEDLLNASEKHET